MNGKYSNGLNPIATEDIINVTDFNDKIRVEFWDYLRGVEEPRKYKSVIWINKKSNKNGGV